MHDPRLQSLADFFDGFDRRREGSLGGAPSSFAASSAFRAASSFSAGSRRVSAGRTGTPRTVATEQRSSAPICFHISRSGD